LTWNAVLQERREPLLDLASGVEAASDRRQDRIWEASPLRVEGDDQVLLHFEPPAPASL